ncbi:MAG: CPBP family glutamic-type intramembrane protease [Candidatus ainarchaeum sp.]|nr:CPBP family glutamic-type intramembrane protease [Candidatus ainarchaeum sp.]
MKPLQVPVILFLILAVIAAAVFMLSVGCQFLQAGFCVPVLDNYIYLGSGAIHLFLLSAALLFLWRKDLRTTLASMGINLDIKNHILFTAIGLTALFTLLFWLQLVALVIGFNDQEKVVEKVSDLPILVLALAVFIAPITEELFFRAMLVPAAISFASSIFGNTPRALSAASLTGIILAAFVFGILHLSYGSVVEIVGVFVIALLLGSIYRISKSVVPCIAVHMIYNLLSIAVMKLMT